MDLDAMLAEAAPARLARLDGPDSPEALDLFQRIVARPPARRLPRRVPVLLGTAAAVVAAVVALVVVPGSPGSPAPAAAAVVLRGAALTATRQHGGAPVRPGQYVYGKTIQELRGGTSISAGAHHTTTNVYGLCTQTVQDWAAPDGSGRQVATAPARSCGISIPSQTFPRGEWLDGAVLPGAAGLPADPEALRRLIVKRFEGRGPEEIGATFRFAGTFLQSGASPAVRAGLYRLIEGLPGITSLGPMTDAIGRHGAGIGYTEHGVRDVLIIDTKTSAVLEREGVVVDPSKVAVTPGTPKFRAGEVVDYTVYLTSGVVNSPTAVPSA